MPRRQGGRAGSGSTMSARSARPGTAGSACGLGGANRRSGGRGGPLWPLPGTADAGVARRPFLALPGPAGWIASRRGRCAIRDGLGRARHAGADHARFRREADVVCRRTSGSGPGRRTLSLSRCDQRPRSVSGRRASVSRRARHAGRSQEADLTGHPDLFARSLMPSPPRSSPSARWSGRLFPCPGR